MADVTSLNMERATRAQDNTLISPIDSLEDVLARLRDGRLKVNKAVVIVLDDTEGRYAHRWFAANMRASEILSLLTVCKARVLQTMGL